MAQIVYDYVKDLEKAMKELDKELRNNNTESNIGKRNWLIKQGKGIERDKVEAIKGH